MVFEGLTAKIDADSADYQSSVAIARDLTDELGDEALDVSLAMSAMASRTDHAKDEMAQLAATAPTASAGISSVGGASSLTATSVASLTGALVLAATALAGVASAALVVGGAFAAIVGAGFLAYGQSVADRSNDASTAMEGLALAAQDLQEQLLPIIKELGQDFIPLIAAAVEQLPALARALSNALGSMEPWQDLLRAIGSGLEVLLPQLARLASDGLRRLLPELTDFGAALVDLLPTLTEFGIIVLQTLLPVLTGFVRALDGVLEAFNSLPTEIQSFLVGAGAMATVLLALLPLLGAGSGLAAALSAVGSAAVTAGSAIAGLASALAGLVSLPAVLIAAATAIGTALGLIGVKALDAVGALDAVRGAGKQLGSFLGTTGTQNLLSFASVLTGGLLPAVTTVGAAIIGFIEGGIPGALSRAQQALSIFETSFRGTFGRIADGARSAIQTITGAIKALVSAIQNVGGSVSDLSLPGLDGGLSPDLPPPPSGTGPLIPSGVTGGGGGGQPVLEIVGDTDIIDSVAYQAGRSGGQDVVTDASRRVGDR